MINKNYYYYFQISVMLSQVSYGISFIAPILHDKSQK